MCPRGIVGAAESQVISHRFHLHTKKKLKEKVPTYTLFDAHSVLLVSHDSQNTPSVEQPSVILALAAQNMATSSKVNMKTNQN